MPKEMLVTSEQFKEGRMPDVFLGGACSMVTAKGHERNPGRDPAADWLDQQKLSYFDPQIHPDTHGRDYIYELDGPVEKAARALARLRIYEITPWSLASVTMFEILDDVRRGRVSLVWFNGGEDYAPFGIGSTDDVRTDEDLEDRMGNPAHAHLVGILKAGRRMRKELQAMTADYPKLMFVRSLDELKEEALKLLK